jgi:hypothetical protein
VVVCISYMACLLLDCHLFFFFFLINNRIVFDHSIADDSG